MIIGAVAKVYLEVVGESKSGISRGLARLETEGLEVDLLCFLPPLLLAVHMTHIDVD